jgi:2-keto-4-pentenoate hydratase/2-oxohepta-3-ene-1,7-dioic acid hydratase in catechol pathway
MNSAGKLGQPKVFMKPGDVIAVEVQGIGILRNPLEAEGRVRWIQGGLAIN